MPVYKMTQNISRLTFEDAIKLGEAKALEQQIKMKRQNEIMKRQNEILVMFDFDTNYDPDDDDDDDEDIDVAPNVIRDIYEPEAMRYYGNEEMQKIKRRIAEMITNKDTTITNDFGNYLLGVRQQILGDEKYYYRNKIFKDLMGGDFSDLLYSFNMWYDNNYEQLAEYETKYNYNIYLHRRPYEWTSE